MITKIITIRTLKIKGGKLELKVKYYPISEKQKEETAIDNFMDEFDDYLNR